VTHPSQRGPDDNDDDRDDGAFGGGGGEYGDEGGDYGDEDQGPVPKPDELLALHSVSAELFDTLRRWFDVPDVVPLDLQAVDSAVAELGEPQMVIAMAMRKLQALHLLATPGVRTATDVVVAIVNDLERAMVQAPNMWLRRQAASTDWDEAFAAMSDGLVDDLDEAPVEADEVDPEVLRFRVLHAALHEAMFAVVEASGGEIRELE
jgi:hypothetical protein